jgi:Protein of unknown function (DUF3300)
MHLLLLTSSTASSLQSPSIPMLWSPRFWALPLFRMKWWIAVVWLKQNANLSGDLLMKAVDQQSWDPAVKALTQFPSVLDNLAKNLAWTSSLGEASATQQQDVMIAIQRNARKGVRGG